MSTGLLVVGVRRLRGQATRFRGPYDARSLADPGPLRAAVEAALADHTWVPRHTRAASFEVRVLDGRRVRRLRSGVHQVRDDHPVPALMRVVWHLPDPPLSAAQGLAALCDAIVAADPGASARVLLERLGEQAAGIRPGRAGWADLARAGTNVLPGGGFAAAYDDGSPWQVRHFAGSVAACLRMGPRLTTGVSVLRGDLPRSADHHLTRAATTFTTALLDGDLAPAGAGDWVREHLVAGPGRP